ncbi:carbohydrate kinase family protein [Patescibacteria group bacterium]
MSNIDLLSVGDASLDVFVDPSESEALCRMDDKECLICFSYGDKIPVRHLEFSVGGNAANNSVGTRRLGISSAAVLTLGSDDIGNQIKKKLENEGVNTSFIIQQPSTTSNYSTVVNYSGERTIFSYKAPRSYEFPVKLPKASWLYLTSMGESFRPFYNHVISWMRLNPETKLAFNPGSRQLRAGVDAIRDVIKISHIIYINRKEAEMITGQENSRGKEKDLLNALVQMGVKKPIVTDGANGSFVFDGEKYLNCGILPIDAHERTGAGDAFGSGCITALIQGKPFEEALLWGTVNSASVIGYTGSQKGLLKQEEIDTWLQRAKSCNVKVEEIK